MMKQFLENRPAFVREQVGNYFGPAEIFLAKVEGPSGIRYKIDGYLEEGGYQGYYYNGKNIEIEIISPHRDNFSHWMVNGEKVQRLRLSLPLYSNTVIEPVLTKTVSPVAHEK